MVRTDLVEGIAQLLDGFCNSNMLSEIEKQKLSFIKEKLRDYNINEENNLIYNDSNTMTRYIRKQVPNESSSNVDINNFNRYLATCKDLTEQAEDIVEKSNINENHKIMFQQHAKNLLKSLKYM